MQTYCFQIRIDKPMAQVYAWLDLEMQGLVDGSCLDVRGWHPGMVWEYDCLPRDPEAPVRRLLWRAVLMRKRGAANATVSDPPGFLSISLTVVGTSTLVQGECSELVRRYAEELVAAMVEVWGGVVQRPRGVAEGRVLVKPPAGEEVMVKPPFEQGKQKKNIYERRVVVLGLVEQGLTYAEITQKLKMGSSQFYCSIETVKKDIQYLRRKGHIQ